MKEKKAIRGWVYVLSNKGMPNLVKIGFTMKDPLLRARELEQTGVPHPFKLEYDVLVFSPREIESKVHRLLASKLERKEWFRCSAQDAKDAIDFTLTNKNTPPNLSAKHRPNQENITTKKNITGSRRKRRSREKGNTKKVLEQGTQWHLTATFSGECEFCDEHFSVTVKRFESNTVVCPNCHQRNTISEKLFGP